MEGTSNQIRHELNFGSPTKLRRVTYKKQGFPNKLIDETGGQLFYVFYPQFCLVDLAGYRVENERIKSCF